MDWRFPLTSVSNVASEVHFSGFKSDREAPLTPLAAKGAKRPHAANVNGNFYVDHTCIDCDTCRWMAPKTFGRTVHGASGQSYVYDQPNEDELDLAIQAMVSCPTGSIRTRKPEARTKDIIETFPLLVSNSLPNVFHLGFHSAKSFGASSYFVTAEISGRKMNIMFDSPRYSTKLAKLLEVAGGVDLMVMSHKDDVADHNKWKERFPEMKRVMHAADVRSVDAWPYIDAWTLNQLLAFFQTFQCLTFNIHESTSCFIIPQPD